MLVGGNLKCRALLWAAKRSRYRNGQGNRANKDVMVGEATRDLCPDLLLAEDLWSEDGVLA